VLTFTDSYLEKRVKGDITIVPLAINYEKTMEGDLYSSELMGNSKVRESLHALLSSSSVLNRNFGLITVTFPPPLSLARYTQDQHHAMSSKSSLPRKLAYTANPGAVPTYVEPVVDTKVESKNTVTTTTTTSSEDSKLFKYDPVSNREHRRHYNRTLAYKIVYDMTRVSECMPTHLVATLMVSVITQYTIINIHISKSRKRSYVNQIAALSIKKNWSAF
jgi:hypothetical protein